LDAHFRSSKASKYRWFDKLTSSVNQTERMTIWRKIIISFLTFKKERIRNNQKRGEIERGWIIGINENRLNQSIRETLKR
jgi:hypothetical protein